MSKERTLSPAAAVVASLRSKASTQAEIIEATGLSRVTVRDRLKELEAVSLVTVAPTSAETGGRPAKRYKLNPAFGRVLVADIGTSVVRAGVASIDGSLLASTSASIAAFEQPEEAFRELFDTFTHLRTMETTPIHAISVGLPVPISPATNTPQAPYVRDAWHNFDIERRLAGIADGPIIVNHDVDLYAIAEKRMGRADTEVLMFIKVGMGIGCSVIHEGVPVVGETGYAFEIGHVTGAMVNARGAERIRCPRGHSNCLETVAGGRAIASALMFEGISAKSSTEIMNLAVAGNSLVRDELYATGQKVGEVIAPLINMLNPGVVIVGGNLTVYSDLVSQGLRETALSKVSRPIKEAVTIAPARLGHQGGLMGACLIALDQVFSSENLERILASSPSSESVSV